MTTVDNYDDIIDLERPVYDDYPPMSVSDRAAQFSPFAALVGYDDIVEETARYTGSMEELTEDEEAQLNSVLHELLDRIDERPEVRVLHFVPDEKKSGGRYELMTGNVRIIDEYEKSLVFTDGERISIGLIKELTFPEEE